ncbi:MAG: sigma-70 family RNA polymerase sigma factor [Planctomycetes bacterium]|nr:sigma-70 family RNA polymerase sigma factor [Planctomycetota bacterium]
MKTPATVESLFLDFRQRGDARALAGVFDRTAPELGRVACYLAGGDQHRAEDLLQTTWLTAMTHADRWDPARPLLPWLLGVLANHARTMQRTARRQMTGAAQLETLLAGDDPVRGSVDGEFAELLKNALAELPSPFREAVGLHVQHGLTAAEIGATLGRPAGTVRTQIVRGLDRLRALLPAGLATTAGAMALSATRLDAMRDTLLTRVPAKPVVPHRLMRVAAAATAVVAIAAVAMLWRPERLAPPAAAGAVAVAPASAEAEPVTTVGQRDAVELPPPPVIAPPVEARPRRAITVHVRHADEPVVEAGEVVMLVHGDDVRCLDTDASGDVTFEDCAHATTYEVFVSGTEAQGIWYPNPVPATFHHELEVQVPAETPLQVTVVDALGAPVVGAEVEGNATQGAYRHMTPLGVTGVDGVLRRRGQRAPQLRARASGHAVSAWTNTSVVDGVLKCRLRLGAAGPQLRGRVVDERGEPVAAELGTISFGSDIPEPWYDRTAADGSFVLDWLSPGHVAVVARVVDGDRQRIGMVRLDLPSSAPIEVRVDEGASLQGTTTRADGAPAGGSQVSLRMLADGAHAFPFCERSLRSWGRGVFSFDGLLPGMWVVTADIGDADVREVIELRSGRPSTWDAAAPALLPLRVRLRDERGAPLAGWRVQVSDPNGMPVGQAVPTDEDGLTLQAMTWRVPGDRPIEVALFDAAAYELHPFLAIWRVPAVVPDGNVVDVVVPDRARSRHWVRGLVVDENGQPLRAQIMVVQRRLRWTGPTARCDENGRFEIGPFAPGHLTATVSVTGRPSVRWNDLEVPAGGDVDLGTITMGPPHRVHAVAAGELVAPKDLQLALFAVGRGESFVLRRRRDGSFSHAEVPAGDYELRGSSRSLRVAPTPVHVGVGAATEVAFALEPASPLRVVVELDVEQRAQMCWSDTLLVRDADGTLLAWRDLDTWFHGHVGPQLEFEVAVPPGELRAEIAGYWNTRRQSVRVDEHGGRVTFPPAR